MRKSELDKAIQGYFLEYLSNPVGKDFDDYVRLRLSAGPMTRRSLISMAVGAAIRG